jgi:AraC family transcriptional regulator
MPFEPKSRLFEIVNVENSSYHQAIATVVKLCLERPGEDLNLADLAAQAGYSPFHFHRIFAAMTGENPAAFLRRLRLERAATQLLESVPVCEVAMEAGFGSGDAFSRAFRQAYGILPSDFRKSVTNAVLPCPNGVHYGQTFTISFQTFGGPQMKTRIEHSPKLHVLGIRHIGPYPTIGQTFQKLGEWVKHTETQMEGSLAVFHDDPERVPADQLRSDALIIVPHTAVAPDGMVTYLIESRKYFVVEYTGAYSGLSDVWRKAFAEELPKQNLVADEGLCYERYLSDMETTPQEELRTDIYIPVK